MNVVFTYSKKLLEVFDDEGKLVASAPANSYVRNELNGERKIGVAGEVEYTVTQDGKVGRPYMPRPAPVGEWLIVGKQITTNKWMQPVKFLTNVHQFVNVWETGPQGYVKETTEVTDDWGYHIHFNNGSVHSDGCVTTLLGLIQWLDNNIVKFPIAYSIRA